MNDVSRYYPRGPDGLEMIEDPIGAWVRWEDFEKLAGAYRVVDESHRWLFQEKKRLEGELAKLQQVAGAAAEPPAKKIPPFRGKPCTCDNCLGSSVPCRVEAGERLGELWYCRKAAESPLKGGEL